MEVRPPLAEEIRAAQEIDPQLVRIKMELLKGKVPRFMAYEDGTLRFHNRACVPAMDVLKRKTLDKGHNTPHPMYPGGNKLYKGLKQTF